MITLSTALVALQASAVAQLGADAFYSGAASANGNAVPIITEKKGDITQQIDLCLGQVGICALVMVPTFEFHQPLAQDLSGWASLTVGIYENGPVNLGTQGTLIPSLALCERTVCVLHWADHGVPTAPTAVAPTAARKFLSAPRTIILASNGPPLQYNLFFQAHVTLNATYS